MIISEITINEAREIDSIKLKINDSLVDYISKEEGVSIEGTPSSFILRNIGIKTLNLDIAIQIIYPKQKNIKYNFKIIQENNKMNY